MGRIDAVLAVDDVTMKGILNERGTADRVRTERAGAVGFVVGKQRLTAVRGVKITLTQGVTKLQVVQRVGGGIVGYQGPSARYRGGNRTPPSGSI